LIDPKADASAGKPQGCREKNEEGMQKEMSMSAKRLVVSCGVLLSALFLSACGSLGGHPPAPQVAESPAHRYKIGPLDNLNIVVWRNPELSALVTVRPDGRISTPLVEDLVAANRSPVDLAREIETVLGKYVRDPVVTVVVNGFQGTYSDQIRIVGEATRPQAVPYRQNMTVLDVMIQVGGLTQFASGNRAVLVRTSQGSNKYFQVKLDDLLKDGLIDANVEVLPGDVLVIPQSWF
jgi:polysaccharide export outer membrane protein